MIPNKFGVDDYWDWGWGGINSPQMNWSKTEKLKR